jgi:hypothetical protein
LQSALDRFYRHDLSGDHIAMEAAALDVSTPIRVMVHTTDSLLAQIDSDYLNKLIHFRPLIAPPPRTLESGVQTMTQIIPVNMTLATTGIKRTSFTRYKGTNDPASRVCLKNWWFDTCWDNGDANKISNKDMVLALANKEGGAHVDGDMSAKYKAAKEQGRIIIGGRPVNDVVRLGSLVGIAGDELLECLQNNFPESAPNAAMDV